MSVHLHAWVQYLFSSFTCSLSMNRFMHRFNLFLGNLSFSSSLTGITLTFLQVLKHTHGFKKYNRQCRHETKMLVQPADCFAQMGRMAIIFCSSMKAECKRGFRWFRRIGLSAHSIHSGWDPYIADEGTLDSWFDGVRQKRFEIERSFEKHKKSLKMFIGSPGRCAMPSKGHFFSHNVELTFLFSCW